MRVVYYSVIPVHTYVIQIISYPNKEIIILPMPFFPKFMFMFLPDFKKDNEGDEIKEHLVLVYWKHFEKGVEIRSGKIMLHASIHTRYSFSMVFTLSQ